MTPLLRIRKFLSRRFLVLTALLGLSAFAIGTVLAQTLPKIRSSVLVGIDRLSREHLPVRILPGAVDVSLFPLGVTMTDVRILPTKNFEKILSPLTIQEISADLSLLQIIRGEVALSRLTVRGTDFSLLIPRVPKSDGKPLEGLFKTLQALPVFEISLSQINAKVEFESSGSRLTVDQLNVEFSKRRKDYVLRMQAESVYATEKSGGRSLRVSPEMELEIAPTHVNISRVDLQRGASSIHLNGRLDGDVEDLAFDAGALDSSLELDVKSIRDWSVKTLTAEQAVPPMTGTLSLQIQASKKNKTPWQAEFKAKAKGYSVQGIWIDEIQTGGVWDGKELILPELTTKSVAGSLKAKSVRIGEGATPTDDGRTPWLMRVEGLHVGVELFDFLEKMGVGPVPVWLSAEGDFPCESRLTPQFNIRCGGTFRGKNAIVQGDLRRGRTPKGAIAGIREFEAKGEFEFNLTKFLYSAEIKMPHSAGRSSGEVAYKTGFHIKYEADRLDIRDLSSLGDLKLEGALKLKGETSGSSSGAVFSMQAEAQDMWLEDFWLGYPKATISYKTGVLNFNGIQGHYTTSRYGGDFAIAFKTNTLTTQLRVPFYDVKDLLKVFSRKFTFPLELTGTGQASIKADGPFALGRLTYDLKSSLFKGSVGGENFDQIYFDVKSNAGEVRSERIQMNRGESAVNMVGVGHPDGTIAADVKGRGIKLEETNAIDESGFALSGLVNFDMTLAGPVLAPDAAMHGTISKTSISESTVPDSVFDLRFTSKTIEGKGSFWGDLVSGEFVWPLGPEAPFKIDFRSQNWNFAPVFAAISGPEGRRDFEGHLTSTISLNAVRGGLWASSGNASIERLSLKRGAIELANKTPIDFSMHDGYLDVKNAEISGEGTFIRLTNQNAERTENQGSKVDLSVNAKIDMNLLTIFTPFFEELRGLLSIALSFKAGPDGNDVIGSALIERGFLKFPNFSYPFEEIQSDLAFNHKKVLINSLKSQFANGKIQATGGLEILGKRQVPVNVTGTFDRISLNIPEKIKTNGSGDFTFAGTWFPFLLKGNYIVKDGLMAREFGDDGSGSAEGATGAKRGQFLPRFLVEESFQPLAVDFNVDLTNGIVLKNELIDGAAAGRLRVYGNPAKSALEGQIRTTGETKVNFRENIFTVTSAVLNFEDPAEINPKVNVQARARIEPYNVSLLVQGTAKKPEISLSSVPPLPERDLLSLLALGVTDQDTGGQQQNQSSGLQVLSAVVDPVLKKVTGRFGLKAQYSAGFDKTDESAQRITVEKEFTRKFGVSGSQTWGKKPKTEGRAHYRFTDRTSVVVSVEGRESGETTDTTDQQGRNQNKLGLDFEYKFEFK